MNILIVGAGGIGSYYGTLLLNNSCNVTFMARGEHYKTLKQKGLTLKHKTFPFDKKIDVINEDKIEEVFDTTDLIIVTTKSTATLDLAKNFQKLFKKEKRPYLLSLQNGVENEEIFAQYIPSELIIGGISRKIGAHIVAPGVIEATGNAETIIGPLVINTTTIEFSKNLVKLFNASKIPTELSRDIHFELWKKLIINNGVNGICALLKEKTGVVMHNQKLSNIVYGLMDETAKAASVKGVDFSKQEIDEMFELITNFDSIKPSMLVDRENRRVLELEEICGVVIKNCERVGVDAPYTKTVSSLLEFMYERELDEEL